MAILVDSNQDDDTMPLGTTEDELSRQSTNGTVRSVNAATVNEVPPSATISSSGSTGVIDEEQGMQTGATSGVAESLKVASSIGKASIVNKETVAAMSRRSKDAAKAVIQEAYDVTDVVDLWASRASIHGIPYTLDSHFRRWRKLAWSCLMAVSFVFLVTQLNALVKEYRKYNVSSYSEVRSSASLPFPMVTICSVLSALGSDATNSSELIAESQTLKEVVLYALFAGKEVLDSEHWRPLITREGVCWVFESDEQIAVPGTSATYGPANGLQLLLSNPVDPPRGGSYIYVTQRNATRPILTHGIVARPAEVTSIGVSRKIFHRETEAPWSRCNNSDGYNQLTCRSACLYEAFRSVNNCSLYGDPVTDKIYCDDPFGELGQHETIKQLESKCNVEACAKPSCYEETYPTMVSSFVNGGSDLSVSINYEAIEEEIITESKTITIPVLFSEMGGVMGLFMGISLLCKSTLTFTETVLINAAFLAQFIILTHIFHALAIFELGDLLFLRLLPRLFGSKHLYGFGSKDHSS